MSSTNYHFKRFCRSVSRNLLQELVDKITPELTIDWNKVLVKNVDVLYQAFLDLPADPHNRLDMHCNEIYDVTENPATMVTMNDLIKEYNISTPESFPQWTDNDKVLWLFLNSSEAWNELLLWGAADAKSRIQWFYQKIDEAADGPGNYTEEQIHGMEREISKYIYLMEGRGCFCHCHPVMRRQSTSEECFLISLNDHPHTEEQWDCEGNLTQETRRGSFEIAMMYNWKEKTLKIKASGVRDHKIRLARIFAHFMLNASITDLESTKMAFLLDQFRNGDIKLPLDQLWDIESAEFTAIGFGVKGCRTGRVTFEDEDGNIQQKIDYASKYGKEPLSTMDIYYVRIKVLMNKSYGRSRRQTIEVFCDRSNIPSLNVKVQEPLSNALKTWKIAA